MATCAVIHSSIPSASGIPQSSRSYAVWLTATAWVQVSPCGDCSTVWPGISAGGPQINHLYIAVRGSIILVLQFDEPNTTTSSGIYNVRNDPDVLAMLTNLLAGHAADS